jgi:hypothetical protein
LAGADDLQHRVTHPQPGILQRQQVDARDDEVAAQAQRIDPLDAREPRDHVEMLGLDERDLPRGQLGFAALTETIVGQPDAGKRQGARDPASRLARRTPHDDGLDPTYDLGRPVQIADRSHAAIADAQAGENRATVVADRIGAQPLRSSKQQPAVFGWRTGWSPCQSTSTFTSGSPSGPPRSW